MFGLVLNGKKNIQCEPHLPAKLLIEGILSLGRDLSKANGTFADSLLLEVVIGVKGNQNTENKKKQISKKVLTWKGQIF